MAYDLSSSPPSLLRGSPSASARFSTISVVGGDIRVVGATRAPPGATVICRGGYESGECPFGRNIILNDDIGGARGGARNRAPPPLPPSTNGCVTRAEMKIVGIACCVWVWKTYGRPCARSTLFAAFPRCASSIFRWGNEIFVPSIFARLEKLLPGIVTFLLFGSNGG